MTTTASPAPTCFASLGQTLAAILLAFRNAVAARGGRDPSVTPLIVLLHTRINRLAKRLSALLAHLAAGTLPAQRPASPRPARAPRERAASPPAARLPHGHFWLFRLMPGTAATFASQVAHQLAQPEVAALLAQAPQAGRILRPLCRLLGVWPEGLLALPSQAGKAAPQPRRAKVAPPSAVALICAAIAARAPVAMDFTPTPDRRGRRRPWLRPP